MNRFYSLLLAAVTAFAAACTTSITEEIDPYADTFAALEATTVTEHQVRLVQSVDALHSKIEEWSTAFLDRQDGAEQGPAEKDPVLSGRAQRAAEQIRTAYAQYAQSEPLAELLAALADVETERLQVLRNVAGSPNEREHYDELDETARQLMLRIKHWSMK